MRHVNCVVIFAVSPLLLSSCAAEDRIVSGGPPATLTRIVVLSAPGEEPGSTKLLVCYVDGQELEKSGATEEDVRAVVPQFWANLLAQALGQALAEFLGGPTTRPAEEERTIDWGRHEAAAGRLAPLLRRGIFVEYREVRGGEVVELGREIIRTEVQTRGERHEN
jgi:hypothetical protein